MFSSDPRIAVVSPSRPGQTAGTWRLQIRQVTRGDEGEYQCSVNTEIKMSWRVVLRVRGKGIENKVSPFYGEGIVQIDVRGFQSVDYVLF